MDFVEPSVELIQEKDNFKRIEFAARTCYRSRDRITDDSAYPFFQRMVKNGHTSTLEHSVIYVRTHTPEAYLWLTAIMNSYVMDTGYQHYIRVSRWDEKDDTFYTPTHRELQLPLGFCLGSEYLLSGNIRAWRKLCERYRNESIIYDTFHSHPAFADIFQVDGTSCNANDPVYTKSDIEIVDSIPENPKEYQYAYMHVPVTLKIIADRGVIDEFARHRVCGVSIESTRYCVAADTVIKTSNSRSHLTVEELYNNTINSKNGSWKRINFKTYNSNTGEFEYAHANNIIYNGEKDCVKITTKLGYTLSCTLDHEILTPNGYVCAGDLTVHDKICVNGTDELYKNKDWLYHQNITLNKTFVQISKEFNFNVSTLKSWARKFGLPKKGTGYFHIGHTPWNKGLQDERQIKALREYHHSGIHDDRKIIKPDTKKYHKHCTGICSICGSKEELHVHHIDKNRENNSPDNLITLCASCHLRVHSNNLLTAYDDEIISIENIGIKKVYDISIDSDNHNYIANGIVVHNCNYSNGGVTFVFPYWFNDMKDDPRYDYYVGNYGTRCYETEAAYQEWVRKCKSPQMARGNLTLWTKSEGVFTATIQQWIDILALRDSPAAHPEAQKISKMIKKILVEQVGVTGVWDEPSKPNEPSGSEMFE